MTATSFCPPFWLRNSHAQTIVPALFRRPPPLALRSEALELSDGDILRLFWGPDDGARPLVAILHGLGGAATSSYVLGLINALRAVGIASVVMQYRGAGGQPNRLDCFYHAAATADLDETVAALRRRFPNRPIALAGYSLGASIILNWLAERQDEAAVAAAAVVSPPFDLAACADHIDRGLARIYQWDLLRSLKRMLRLKYRDRDSAAVDLSVLRRIRTLRQFDDLFTAPMHGFGTAAEYYRLASCAQRLHAIRRTTLIVHAQDDPFIPASTIPAASTLPDHITLELHRHGGHVGFVASSKHGGMRWLDRRLARWLAERLTAPARHFQKRVASLSYPGELL